MRVLCLLAVAGCGRFAFDPRGDAGAGVADDSDVVTDTRTGDDASGLDCSAAWQTTTISFTAPVDITPFDTTGRDHDPVLLPDRVTLYFSSSRPGSANGDDDVWRAIRPAPDEPWNQLERIVSLSSGFDEGGFFTRDNLTGWQSSARGGGLGASDLWLGTRNTEAESFVVTQVTLDNVNTIDSDFDAWVSPDQLRLYYSVDGTLRVSERATPTAVWPASTVLPGADLGNGAYDPSLTRDELALVFTADDVDSAREIYVATRPSRTVAFGPRSRLSISGVGTTDYDAWLSDDACEIYWATDRGRSFGDLALWMATVVP